MSSKRSLCQDCFNFECSWHTDFILPEYATAVPTKINNKYQSGKIQVIDSYLVTKCRGYRSLGGFRRVTLEALAKLMNISIRAVRTYYAQGLLHDKLLSYGYLLRADKIGKNNHYYIKKV